MRRLITVVVAALLLVVLSSCAGSPDTASPLLFEATTAPPTRAAPSPSSPTSMAPSTSPAATATRPTTVASSTAAGPTASPAVTPGPTESTAPAVVTPQGMWWGVDSTVAISRSSLANVRGWYRGATPQFWGRYLNGSYAVTAAELATARHLGIDVFLIVPDHNCSGCGGGSICDNDRTAAQARADADTALADARRLRLPRGTRLFKDIEEVGGCAAVTPDYLTTWYRTLHDSEFRTGFYGNVHEQSFGFPRAYCAAIRADAGFRDDVVLDMNEDEPLIGAPRNSTGPHEAPRFAPKRPDCAPAHTTVVWQYGESTSRDNLTDIDEARPDIAGLLDTHGWVTGAGV